MSAGRSVEVPALSRSAPDGGGPQPDFGFTSYRTSYALDLRFKTGQYQEGATSTTDIATLPGYSYARTGSKQELNASSALVSFAANVPAIIPDLGYWARSVMTNILLNTEQAANLATQTVTVSAQAYTLSFIGTGSVDLSGAHVATLTGTGASNRVPLTFTPTAGSLTLTVTGTVQYAVLVAGPYMGPIIATAGAAASVGVDDLRLSHSVPVEDFLMWTVLQTEANNINASILFTLIGDAGAWYRLQRTGQLGAILFNNGGFVDQILPGGGQPTSGRSAAAVRRRAGKTSLILHRYGIGTTINPEIAETLPTGLTTLHIGHHNAGGGADVLIEGVFRRAGTFSDADVSRILGAS